MAEVSLEFTPNPNSLKFNVFGKTLTASGAFNFRTPLDAEGKSPLACRIFEVSGVSGVMVGKDFVTVIKTPEADLSEVHEKARSALCSFLDSEQTPVTCEAERKVQRTDLEVAIESYLDAEVKPKLAQDGGSVSFEGFDGGVVYLQLQGSCSTCPSSKATLKRGIEVALKRNFPEVSEVVSV